MIPGLVSVTFRQLSTDEILDLCVKAGLTAIEWGGDIHVPPDGQNAREVLAQTRSHGMSVASYGSYYRVGDSMDDFMRVLDTAALLETDTLRIWCGRKGSNGLSPDERKQIVDDLLACAEKAEPYGIYPALEFHGGTLTDSLNSVSMLLQETLSADNLRFYWQPRWDWTFEDNMKAIALVSDRLAHVHAFCWKHTDERIIRLPLSEGSALMKKALPYADKKGVLLEFVDNDSPEVFLRDAKTLLEWNAVNI